MDSYSIRIFYYYTDAYACGDPYVRRGYDVQYVQPDKTTTWTFDRYLGKTILDNSTALGTALLHQTGLQRACWLDCDVLWTAMQISQSAAPGSLIALHLAFTSPFDS